jgi:hypothetical protein
MADRICHSRLSNLRELAAAWAAIAITDAGHLAQIHETEHVPGGNQRGQMG